MPDLTITTTIRETPMTIAETICLVWESDKDTPAVYAEHCRVHQADLAHSVIGFLPYGRIAGIGILCRRGDRGFVLDFGIAPDCRGRGLGHRLFQALMAEVARADLREVTLIVSVDNEPAIRIYRQAGFQKIRALMTLRGKVAAYAPGSAQELSGDHGAAIMAWFGGGKSARPHWERDLPSLLAMSNVRAFENSRGFLLTRLSPYFHRQVDIVHIGLDPEAVTEDVNALLYAVSDVYNADMMLALPEEPENSRAAHLLASLGFQVIDRSYEMRLAR